MFLLSALSNLISQCAECTLFHGFWIVQMICCFYFLPVLYTLSATIQMFIASIYIFEKPKIDSCLHACCLYIFSPSKAISITDLFSFVMGIDLYTAGNKLLVAILHKLFIEITPQIANIHHCNHYKLYTLLLECIQCKS